MFESLQIRLKKFSYEPFAPVLFEALEWQLAAGKHCLLTGSNGSGKTTFLKILCGLLPVPEGALLLNNKKKEAYSRETYLSFFGMVFQKNALFDDLSVEGQLDFVLRLSREPSLSRIETYLRAVQLWEARGKYPNELSGGMKKRLAVVRALICSPAILLCDDPTAGLDPITAAELLEFLFREAEAIGSTLVVAAQPRLTFKKWFRIGARIQSKRIHTFQMADLEKEFPTL